MTNKHVLKNVESFVIRFNPKRDESAHDYEINLNAPKDLLLVNHPNPDVDVAVIYLNPKVLEQDQADLPPLNRSDAYVTG